MMFIMYNSYNFLDLRFSIHCPQPQNDKKTDTICDIDCYFGDFVDTHAFFKCLNIYRFS